MVFFNIRMGYDPVFNMPQKFLGGKQLTASFAPFEGMTTDDFVANGDRSHAFSVVQLDRSGRTNVSACTAADAKAFCGCHIIFAPSLFHLEGAGAHNFCTHSDTEAATNATVGWWSKIDPALIGQLPDTGGLRGHLQKILERPGSCLLHQIAFCPDYEPIFDFEYACQHGQWSTCFTDHFHSAQLA
jgi:hypothetical protein